MYQVHEGEQLGYRYIVQKLIGLGAFGQVLRCLDMKENGRAVAIKVSKNGKKEVQNAQTELKILEYLNQKDTDNYNILKFYESFTFRGHFLIVTEILGMNLIEYID